VAILLLEAQLQDAGNVELPDLCHCGEAAAVIVAAVVVSAPNESPLFVEIPLARPNKHAREVI